MKVYHQDLKYLLIIDIETVACAPTYEAMPEALRKFWDKRAKSYVAEISSPAEAFDKYASLHAEFSRVVSIGVGFFNLTEKDELGLRVKSLVNDDEKQLLTDFKDLLERRLTKRKRLVAHNGREFDYPFLCRRMLLHGLGLPPIFQNLRSKPWDNPHLDTMEMWRFGDRKNFTSLRLLAYLFDLPPYQDPIDGGMVSGIYHKEKDLDRISAYCRNDVIMTAQLYLCLQNLTIVKEENVVEV
jgi:predicted PolB exonuclease-like 3'-5' exonuclease